MIVQFLGMTVNFQSGSYNPYTSRQTPETISKKTGGDSGDIPETLSRLFPDFVILGRDSSDFPETISR